MRYELDLTRHANNRIDARGISRQSVAAAMDYGRELHTRGTVIYVIGRREINRLRRRGVDLSAHEGVHVVCGEQGQVVTAWRNRDLRPLRPRRRPHIRRGRSS
jgi:hypothetical protein